jgi:CrcB protein
MTTYLAVAAAAAAGAILRYLFAQLGNADLPIGTLVVNLVASFVMGLVAANTDTSNLAFQVGLLGTMSTWSTLAHEVAQLARDRRGFEAAVYLVLSVVLGIGAAWIGLIVGR